MVAKSSFTSGAEIAGNKFRSPSDAAVGFEYITAQKLREILYGKIPGFETKIAFLMRNYSKNQDLHKITQEFSIYYNVLPLAIESTVLYYATGCVFSQTVKRKLRAFFPGIHFFCPIYFSSSALASLIEKYHLVSENAAPNILKQIQSVSTHKAISSGLIKNLVTILLERCIILGASDVHLEPEQSLVRVRYRIDGDLVESYNIPSEFWDSIVTGIKINANIDLIERRLPQDGKITISFLNRTINFRLSTYPTISGENIVLRALDSSKSIKTLEEIGFRKHVMTILQKVLLRPDGVLLMTGPTGSGKTTTLYSILAQINSPNVNIMTLEDPVEYIMPYARQSNINTDIGFTFERGIRSILRQDPDIILMGEIRDTVTAQDTFRAASTGHLVLSTLHTNSAIGSIARLTDLGIIKASIADHVIAAMAQRLVRQLCKFCKVESSPTDLEAETLLFKKNEYGQYPTIWRKNPKGCAKCGHVGYKGRCVVSEIVPITAQVANLIVQNAQPFEILAFLRQEGLWYSLLEDGIDRLLEGTVDYESLQSAVDLSQNALEAQSAKTRTIINDSNQ